MPQTFRGRTLAVRESLTLRQAAQHVQIDENELRHIAQRGEIEADMRGGEWRFDHAALDEWAQRHLLSSNAKSIAARHAALGRRLGARGGGSVSEILNRDAIDLFIEAKAKAGIVRDMTDLAEKSGFVYDPEFLFKELLERENAASTAVGSGAAFLHPRHHDPYMFEESFVAYGRSARPVFFGAPDGAATRHFFLVCSTDHERHLHLLARLAVLAHGTDLLERLDAAETADDVFDAVRACEAEFST